jgi:hypothetical protein
MESLDRDSYGRVMVVAPTTMDDEAHASLQHTSVEVRAVECV